MSIVIIFELVRLKNENLNQKLLKIFDGIYRQDEVKKVSTLIFTLSGIFFTILFFEKKIAVLSILFLTFGDGFAALAGEKFGKHKIFKNSNKTAEGTAANLIACIITGFLFLFLAPAALKPNIVQIIFGSIALAVVEAMPIPKDNLFIPVISGFVMKLLK